jgi:hypothetical protein
MSDAGPTDVPARNPEGAVTPEAAAATVTTTTGGISFDFVYNNNTYTCKVYAGDAHGQFGFTITETTSGASTATTVASLIYLPPSATTAEGWQIQVNLPNPLQIDTNLSLSQLGVEITKGTVYPLAPPPSS